MMKRPEILSWLRETDAERLESLWRAADAVRREHVGDAVQLRGLIEISNICVRLCGYCGLRAPNQAIERYRMSADEIVACARQARDFGYGTVVIQAGEDPGLTQEFVAEIVRRIKAETGLAITLSLGERSWDELAAWKAAGADRYLLRFETSNGRLFAEIHPAARKARRHGGTEARSGECGRLARWGEAQSKGNREQGIGNRPDEHAQPESGPQSQRTGRCGTAECEADAGLGVRLTQLRALRELGYEVGSGVMIGIPGQSYENLANDLELFRSLDLDMIGCGPFLPHPATPLGQVTHPEIADQVPNTELMTYKVVALARLVCPRANIPSTTALATLNRAQGRELGLMRGANVVMPNLTPPQYRAKYEIYPAKACLFEDAGACHGCMQRRIESIGRTIGVGPGGSPNWQARMGEPI